jgi:hypothetical protein
MKLPNTVVEQEYTRCGNCGFTHFMHLIVPDVGTDICPPGIGMPPTGTTFRLATDEDFARWGRKRTTRMAVTDTLREVFRRRKECHAR